MAGRLTPGNLLKTLVVFCAGGVALATACTPKQIQAVVTGIQAATDSLEGSDRDDISLTDWLISELED